DQEIPNFASGLHVIHERAGGQFCGTHHVGILKTPCGPFANLVLRCPSLQFHHPPVRGRPSACLGSSWVWRFSLLGQFDSGFSTCRWSVTKGSTPASVN